MPQRCVTAHSHVPALQLLPADSQPAERSRRGFLPRDPLDSAHQPKQLLAFPPSGSFLVVACPETPILWLAPPHLQITIFWVACMHVGRADDKAESAGRPTRLLERARFQPPFLHSSLVACHSPGESSPSSPCSTRNRRREAGEARAGQLPMGTLNWMQCETQSLGCHLTTNQRQSAIQASTPHSSHQCCFIAPSSSVGMSTQQAKCLHGTRDGSITTKNGCLSLKWVVLE